MIQGKYKWLDGHARTQSTQENFFFFFLLCPQDCSLGRQLVHSQNSTNTLTANFCVWCMRAQVRQSWEERVSRFCHCSEAPKEGQKGFKQTPHFISLEGLLEIYSRARYFFKMNPNPKLADDLFSIHEQQLANIIHSRYLMMTLLCSWLYSAKRDYFYSFWIPKMTSFEKKI